MHKIGFKFKIFLGIIAVVLIPLIFVSIFSSKKSVALMRSSAEIQSLRTASSLATSVSLVIAEQERIVGCLSELFRSFGGMDIRFYGGAGMDELTSSRVNAKISNLLHGLGANYESIYLGDADGILFAGADETEKTSFSGVDISTTDIFKTVKELGAPIFGKVAASGLTGKPVMVFLAPILDQHNEFAGVIGMTFKLDPLTALVGGTKNGATGYGFMVDRSGQVLAHPTSSNILKLNISRIDTMQEISKQILSMKSGASEYFFEGREKIAGFAPVIKTGWSVVVTQDSNESMAVGASIWKFNGAVAGLCFILAIASVLFLIHRFFRPVEQAVSQINLVTSSVSNGAREISSGCHTLAQAASEQTGTLDQTVLALSEVSAFISENNEHAGKTQALVQMSQQVVSNTARLMELLGKSMDAIEETEEKTATIVRTIEDIAFQTNLLALNAAVEAVRAGDAGGGFGVVAKHFRELAIRASAAAKDSAQLIEESTEKVRQGSGLVKEAKTSFSDVAEHTIRIGTSMESISAASLQQATAVERIRSSMSDLEDMTHHYAAFAEQSATATLQMVQEVTSMSEISDSLAAAVGQRLSQNASTAQDLHLQ